MDDERAARLEEALFEEPRHAAFFAALRDQLRALSARGTFHPVLREDEAARLRAHATVRVGEIEIGMPVDREALLASEVLLVRVPLDLEGVSRLDVETAIGAHEPAIYPDVPFDPGAGCVWLCCEIELAVESAALGAVQRFVAVRGAERRVLREVRLGEL